jgi:hypothetical protein
MIKSQRDPGAGPGNKFFFSLVTREKRPFSGEQFRAAQIDVGQRAEFRAGITQVIILSVSMVTYARFEWPDRTHGRIIFHHAAKKQDRITPGSRSQIRDGC